MAEKSEYVLIEDSVALRIVVAKRMRTAVAYASRGDIIERFEYCAEFLGGPVLGRDRAMAFIRSETGRLAEQEREAGSRTP